MAFISYFLHFIGIFFQYFLLYKPSDEIFDESMAVSQAIFESEWYLYQVEIQKILLIVMMRCQKPLHMSIGSFYKIRIFLLEKVCVP